MSPRLPNEQLQRRDQKRFRVADLYVTSPVVDLVVLDLSSRGMSIETRQPLRVGASHPFTIRSGRRQALLNGDVRWCKLHRMIDIGGEDFEPLFRCGVVFPGNSEDLRKLVESSPSQRMVGSGSSTRSQTRTRPPSNCPDCGVAVLADSERCRMCGSILPRIAHSG
jgi:hypothetical protein